MSKRDQTEIRNIIRMNLCPLPFSFIKNKRKDVEMRLYDERRRHIQIGDIIIFTHTETGEELYAEVLELRRFKDFKALYAFYPKTRIGYEENDVAKPEDMLQYYTQDAIDRYGALAIVIRLLDEKAATEI